MHIETNLDRIRQLGEERAEENWEFRTFLRHCGDESIDERVRRVLKGVAAGVDCAACANCCKELRPTVTGADIERLSQALSVSPEGFRRQYIEETHMSDLVLRGLPCPFLKDNRRTVAAHQPDNCRDFPNLQLEGFTYRLMGVVSSYGVCPLVFNVYEQLKEELGWRPGADIPW